MNYLICLFSFLFMVDGCQPDMDKMKITIDHYRIPCSGEGTFLCMRVKPEFSNAEWIFHYDGIEGFEYEPGYIYELEIEQETIENPPADGSSILWKLSKVISKERVDENVEFQLSLRENGMTHINQEAGCNFLYDWPIEVEEEDCEKLKKAEKATFRHSNPPGKLVLVKID